MTEVTQADREAAIAHYESQLNFMAANVLRTDPMQGDNWPLVQVLARHRQSTEIAAMEAVARWIEAQRNDCPAQGREFAAAIRNDAHDIQKGLSHG